MTAFTMTISGPDDFRQVRRFPSVWCAAAALQWATMLDVGYTADTAEAQRAKQVVDRLRMKAEQAKTKENGRR